MVLVPLLVLATEGLPGLRQGRMTSTMRVTGLVLILSAGFLLFGCRPADEPPPTARSLDPAAFSGARAYEAAQGLVDVGPRDAGTPGAEAAAEHLRDQLRAVGVETSIQTFEDDTARGPVVFRNVVGAVPGTGPGLVVLGSHYDTKTGMEEGFEGANDSASSSGALVELARVIAAEAALEPLPMEFRFVFFDGEECHVTYGPRDGFHGSRHYARSLLENGEAERARAVIILDMIGDRDLTLTLPRNGDPQLLSMVLAAARDEGIRSAVALASFAIGDDHVPFLEAGMPAVDIIDFQFGSAPGLNDYWHTGEDRMDKISPESLAKVGRLTISTLNRVVAREP